MKDELTLGVMMAFVFGVIVALALNFFMRDSPDESKIKAFTQICNKFDVQVTDNEYRLSCSKGYIDVDSKGYLMASKIQEGIIKK